ncbi:MAG: D-tyrosyl-tRNA(Tyr) deacylase [Chloroflexi bacterium]|nr:D-tyrosyl-tRNA(Tyr) deacylase [Chloroflexota bacterium]
MRAVLQRVHSARVLVDGEAVGVIERGVLVYLGVADGDTESEAGWLADRIAGLRIFASEERPIDRSLLDVDGAALVVSQFTLLADTRRGRRPSFTGAAPPEVAEPLVEAVVNALREQGVEVATGRFGAMMQVESTNDGPVTIILDSADRDRPRRG